MVMLVGALSSGVSFFFIPSSNGGIIVNSLPIPPFQITFLSCLQVMLPFSPPKGNLCRILSALRDVRTFIEDNLRSGATRPIPCLSLGVIEACGQYRRHLNAIGQLQVRFYVRVICLRKRQLQVVAI